MISQRVISFILQASVVIIGVFIFSFFDPFNIFNTRKLKSRETPTVVTEIKAMGKLITAEYYGEVIKASGDSIYEQAELMKKDHRSRLLNINERLISSLGHLKKDAEENKDKTNNRWQVYRLFREQYANIVDDPDYDVLISIIHDNTGDPERLIIKQLFDGDGKIAFPKNNNGIAPKLETLIDNYLVGEYNPSKKERKWISNHEIVLLGRGSVKAGIDFSNFDTKHMNYITDKNLIRLYRHQPEIISATINPWFIPEKQIKGFEYLFISQKLREGDDAQSVQQSTQLKQECLDMLQDDARHAGILEHARENAETVLSNFFSLILDKEIKVEIYGSKLEPYLNGLLAKKKLSGLDLVMIDSVVGRFLKEDTVGTREFLREAYDSLTMPEPWPAANKNLRISAFYYQVSDDEFLSKKEQDSLAYVTSDTSVSYRDMLYYSIVDAKADRKAVKANKVYDLEALKTKVGSLRKEPDPNIKP